jgi:hypothetical protein
MGRVYWTKHDGVCSVLRDSYLSRLDVYSGVVMGQHSTQQRQNLDGLIFSPSGSKWLRGHSTAEAPAFPSQHCP